MPNWCENDLRVNGPKKEVKEFLDHVKTEKTKFDYETILPYPVEFRKLDEAAKNWEELDAAARKDKGMLERPRDGFNSGGYDWCVTNWGTKWNNLDGEYRSVDLEFDENWDPKGGEAEATFHFDSAWSPPILVIFAASKLFPLLVFELRYFEGGMGFNGLYRVEHGEVKFNKIGDYFGNRGG